MAQNARLAALTDELIHSILKFDPHTNKQAYKHAKDIASKGLRAHQYARTNQFDVQSSFTGLEEKFRVLNRDDLADALDVRVKEINQRRGKWIPEFLSLLLQLSDRPTENSDVGALELLRPPSPPPELTWKQILEEDPYSDEEIWKDIDYGGESSEDEFFKKKQKGKGTRATSVEEDDTYDPEACVVLVDVEVMKELEESQFWTYELRDEEEKVEITELQAVRETLFMLAGLQSSLYLNDKQSNSIRVNHKYVFGHAMQKTADHLLAQLADIGRALYRLRQWIKRPSSLPLVQTFEAAVQKRLDEYDRMLANLQHLYLVPKAPISVSLLELHDQIRTGSRPILRLAQLVEDIEPQLLVNPFVHLETLFDQISLAQMTLEKDVFDFLSCVFFECLQTYLKPIRRWMESGELGLNDETFFVFENDSSSEVSSLWHDRFVLRRGQENALRSPTFLQPAAHKIFNTGKSLVFLKELGIYGAGLNSSEPEPRLDHETVCGISSEMPLSPFPELFQAAFQTWISTKYSFASTVLREHLFSECGLMRVLGHFKTLYLSANGSIFQDFADAIFKRMDEGQRGWNDRFLLTELARGIFTPALNRTHADKIVVRSVRSKARNQFVKGLGNVYIDYALPWPIMNIIQRSAIPIYQQISTFLLQTYRIKYLVQRVSPRSIQAIGNTRLRQLSYRLRQRLIWFTDILRSYLSEAVIDLSTEDMIVAMKKADDIDEMASIHMKYVARLQDQALLSENLKPIHKAIIQILDLGVTFAVAHSSRAMPTRTSATRPALSSRAVSSSKTSKFSKSSRRKSVIPAIVEDDSSDSDSDDEEADEGAGSKAPAASSSEESVEVLEKEFGRLLPFVTAGLKSVGRVSAEPAWEMLAERWGWEERKGARSFG
ncbi:hypothetical protein K458DRAFT_300513 [Lentithecium fluviatile CBS 122367]|uniref:Spindle pole body component n=1 Tax=Lentithecium fluviatile CBS 122367 TaxID=1168545 RepID=A0A6G1J5G1_9PLEO|nr:hypothetical protein K458DRAFT_300513 [Lentithecium fluviatile CBS 122367]